jgi:hypothetical protein
VAFVVLVAESVRRLIDSEMTKRERRSYDAAIEALKGEGCRAGGKRMMSTDAGDYPMCQRALYGSWRMITIYRQDGTILIVAVERHLEETVAAGLADTFPGLSATGRHRSEQPLCCADAAAPPTLSDELEARLASIYGMSDEPSATRRPTRRRRAPSSGRRRTRRPSGTAA